MIALLLAIIPYCPVIETQCDLYEHNRIYGDDGKPVLTQRVFWNLPDVLGWRIAHHRDVPVRGGVMFFDGTTTPIMRRIRYGSRVDSHTNYDPEMEARQVLSPEHRRELGVRP